MAAHVVGVDILRQGTQLIDPTGAYQYDVAAACSGIRSLISIFLLSTCYGFVVFRAATLRLLMIVLAVPFAVLGNFLRLMLIVIAAEIGGQSWGNYVHENLIISLVPYLPAFIGVFVIGAWMKKRWPSQVNEL
jgi:exosortase